MESLSLSVKNDRAEIPRLAQVVSEFCERNGLSSSVELDLNLVLEEVVINVMAHGFEDQEPHEIGVSLSLEGGELTVTVEDDGIAFNPLEAPEAAIDQPIEERRPGGLGIFLVKSLMDELEYRRVGNKNMLVMKKST